MTGNFTIFAPVDSAFTHTPADVLRNLLTDHSRLADVLKYHVVSGNVMSSAVRNDLLLPSLFSGKKIRLNDYDSGRVVTATGSKITQVDLQASNGVIHLIDRLMYPIPDESALQYLASKPNFTQLAYNAIRANIATELQCWFGRTGTYVPLICWDMLKSGRLEENFSLYEIIKPMREQRQSMIQTPF
ncbi:hypothetical protein KUTeg_021274 [Tegillarca granosa]|uniref:FAS1 domain-containing protein n=1 Tax=Tegillarca granosa TaxID=220873 RepID=A0ABQ9EAD8_TEGGR|nr:hypothetical protein KUTeg_021274 [Tegillarca granosa]